MNTHHTSQYRKCTAQHRNMSVFTKYVNGINHNLKGDDYTDVLSWKSNNKWRLLSPYYLKTDGEEENYNKGGIIFENFYQGSKLYPFVYSIEVYPSKWQHGNPEHLHWEYKSTSPEGDICYDTDTQSIRFDNYMFWRWSLWECQHPIRYPNGYHKRRMCKGTLILREDGNFRIISYIEARKELYVKEYSRLIRKTKEYSTLIDRLRQGKDIILLEIDVPKSSKKGLYGSCVTNKDGITTEMSLDLIDGLMKSPDEPFGHGLCIAKCLLEDIKL